MPADDGLSSRRHELALRIVSGALLAPLTLAAIYAGATWLAALLLGAAIAMAVEWANIVMPAQRATTMTVIMAAAAAGVVLTLLERTDIAIAAALAGCLVLALTTRLRGLPGIWPGSIGPVYIVLPCISLLWLRGIEDRGLVLVLWLMLVVWGTDIGGYVAGRAFGGARLAPSISPNKTWSGAIGATLGGLVCSLAMLPFAGHGALMMAGMGVLFSLLAQGGDLLESAIKRHCHVKDASQLIPGHGGMLDRVDGILATAPLLALSMTLNDYLEGRLPTWP